MKKLLLSGFCLIAFIASTQTTLYSENFESGNSFTLNSTDLGASTIYNTWLMNNTYSGGSGTFVCLGFPFSFTVTNTPAQPIGITNAPSSNYMHITAQAAVSSGINCASYIPADGTCVTNESNFTKMTAPISTIGFTDVSFDFWWMCAGSVDAFGELYYSLNGGSTWILKQSNMNNVTNWSQSVFTDAAWENQASLMFAFRFVNNITSTAADPSFCVDELLITATVGGNNITTTDDVSPADWCFNSTEFGTVNFVATGTYTVGNIYSAELSDAAGSFASPTIIGTLASTASGSLSISTTIPSGIVAGTGYRVRVVSSTPSTTGTDNTANLIIHALPTVNQIPNQELCAGEMTSVINFSGSLMGTTYNWENDNSSIGLGLTGVGNINSFSAINSGVNPLVGTITVTPTSNGCDGAAEQFTITVNNCSASIDENDKYSFELIPNPASDEFTITSDFSLQSIELIDLSGRKIKSYDANSTKYSLENVPSGIYIVQILSNGTYGSQRLIVE